MGLGPIRGEARLRRKRAKAQADMDVIESKRGFPPSRRMAVTRDLSRSRRKSIPNGGAVAARHPIGGKPAAS